MEHCALWWGVVQGPPAEGTITAPKKKHHTGQFKSAALSIGPNFFSPKKLVRYFGDCVSGTAQHSGLVPRLLLWDEKSEISLEMPGNWEEPEGKYHWKTINISPLVKA